MRRRKQWEDCVSVKFLLSFFFKTNLKEQIQVLWGHAWTNLRGRMSMSVADPEFSKNCMNMIKFDPERDVSLVPPLDPPMCVVTKSKLQKVWSLRVTAWEIYQSFWMRDYINGFLLRNHGEKQTMIFLYLWVTHRQKRKRRYDITVSSGLRYWQPLMCRAASLK